MPCFCVSIEVLAKDRGIGDSHERGVPAGGFTTRFVRTSDPEKAIQDALNRIDSDLEQIGIWESWHHKVEDVHQTSWWKYVRRAPGKGFSFYAAD